MDEARVLARLDRIDALDRTGAAPGELLAELRGLLGEAERTGTRTVVGGRARGGGGRAPRTALARDIIGACSPTGTRSRAAARKPATSRASGPISARPPGRRRSASTGSRSIRASGRRRSTARPARRRSSSCSRGSGVCLLSDRPSRSAPATASSTACASRTRCARATTGSTCSPSASAGGRRRRTCRARTSRWLGGSWVEAGTGEHPWEREAAAGEPELPELGERPGSVVHVDDVEGDHDGGSWRLLARTAGAERTGLNWGRLPRRRGGRAAAQPFRRRGDLRRARGRGHARALSEPAAGRGRRRLRGAADSRRPRDLASRRDGDLARRSAPASPDSPSWPTGRGGPTTSATTRARTRSTSAAWA